MNLDSLRSYFSASGTFDPGQAVVLALVLLVLSSLVSLAYYYLGNSLSNRGRLAAILPLMSLTTMLIISVIQSSLALSLGLVGALSIVRFRSAIKDPEELAYIFLTIALGLGFGANQPIIAMVFFVIIMAVIVVQALLRRKVARVFTDKDSLHLELQFSKSQQLSAITKLITPHCSELTLVRMHDGDSQTIMFLIKPNSTAALDTLQDAVHTNPHLKKMTLLHYQPLV